MSKKLGVFCAVASFVFACSFLAAIPAQADTTSYTLEGNWIEIAGVEFTYTTTPSGSRWNASGWENSKGMAFPEYGTGYSIEDNSHYLRALSFDLPPDTKVVAKLFVDGADEGADIDTFFEGLEIRPYGDGVVEAPIFVPHVSSTDVSEATADIAGDTVSPSEMYLLDLEEVFVNRNLQIKINRGVASAFEQYSVVFMVEAADNGAPEPATLAVFGLGLLGTGLAARRRRNKK